MFPNGIPLGSKVPGKCRPEWSGTQRESSTKTKSVLQRGHDFAEGVYATLVSREKAKWQPAELKDVDLGKLKFEYFESASPHRLKLPKRKDYMQYPHRKFMLPSENDIKLLVTGEAADAGTYALNSEEVVNYFVRERKGKQGVKAKVLDVLKRKTRVIENDPNKSLKWIY